MTKLTTALFLSLLAGLAACQRDAPPAGADTRLPSADADAAADAIAPPKPAADDDVTAGNPPPTIEIPPADAPTPAIAAGAQIVYTCEDGSELQVTYSGSSATFALEDGRVVTLPRAESASKGGGDVYVSDTVGLQRLSNVVQVERDSGAKRVCAESGGNA
jgi:hypothetical protein